MGKSHTRQVYTKKQRTYNKIRFSTQEHQSPVHVAPHRCTKKNLEIREYFATKKNQATSSDALMLLSPKNPHNGWWSNIQTAVFSSSSRRPNHTTPPSILHGTSTTHIIPNQFRTNDHNNVARWQCNKRWSSPKHLHNTHVAPSNIVLPFLKLTVVKIIPLEANHVKKQTFLGALGIKKTGKQNLILLSLEGTDNMIWRCWNVWSSHLKV